MEAELTDKMVNLREGTEEENCGLCQNLLEDGTCAMLGKAVLPTQVCDLFTGIDLASGKDMMADVPVEMLL